MKTSLHENFKTKMQMISIDMKGLPVEESIKDSTEHGTYW